VRIVELPRPLPLPGQMKPVEGTRQATEPTDPAARVNQANAQAQVQPVRNGFINSMQVYPFTQGALYQVYTAVGQITDIALQPGEQLVGAGPVAAGDAVRWIIGDTESGTGAAKQVHILVKPTRPTPASAPRSRGGFKSWNWPGRRDCSPRPRRATPRRSLWRPPRLPPSPAPM
jgi:type IV secretory pathway VirB9-like protein